MHIDHLFGNCAFDPDPISSFREKIQYVLDPMWETFLREGIPLKLVDDGDPVKALRIGFSALGGGIESLLLLLSAERFAKRSGNALLLEETRRLKPFIEDFVDRDARAGLVAGDRPLWFSAELTEGAASPMFSPEALLRFRLSSLLERKRLENSRSVTGWDILRLMPEGTKHKSERLAAVLREFSQALLRSGILLEQIPFLAIMLVPDRDARLALLHAESCGSIFQGEPGSLHASFFEAGWPRPETLPRLLRRWNFQPINEFTQRLSYLEEITGESLADVAANPCFQEILASRFADSGVERECPRTSDSSWLPNLGEALRGAPHEPPRGRALHFELLLPDSRKVLEALFGISAPAWLSCESALFEKLRSFPLELVPEEVLLFLGKKLGREALRKAGMWRIPKELQGGKTTLWETAVSDPGIGRGDIPAVIRSLVREKNPERLSLFLSDCKPLIERAKDASRTEADDLFRAMASSLGSRTIWPNVGQLGEKPELLFPSRKEAFLSFCECISSNFRNNSKDSREYALEDLVSMMHGLSFEVLGRGLETLLRGVPLWNKNSLDALASVVPESAFACLAAETRSPRILSLIHFHPSAAVRESAVLSRLRSEAAGVQYRSLLQGSGLPLTDEALSAGINEYLKKRVREISLKERKRSPKNAVTGNSGSQRGALEGNPLPPSRVESGAREFSLPLDQFLLAIAVFRRQVPEIARDLEGRFHAFARKLSDESDLGQRIRDAIDSAKHSAHILPFSPTPIEEDIAITVWVRPRVSRWSNFWLKSADEPVLAGLRLKNGRIAFVEFSSPGVRSHDFLSQDLIPPAFSGIEARLREEGKRNTQIQAYVEYCADSKGFHFRVHPGSLRTSVILNPGWIGKHKVFVTIFPQGNADPLRAVSLGIRGFSFRETLDVWLSPEDAVRLAAAGTGSLVYFLWYENGNVGDSYRNFGFLFQLGELEQKIPAFCFLKYPKEDSEDDPDLDPGLGGSETRIPLPWEKLEFFKGRFPFLDVEPFEATIELARSIREEIHPPGQPGKPSGRGKR